ncbi:uncharacterized protein UV8b_06032 [Ustilaginoidea virens]|uniref:non-specific serine/threonine protein kinase n=1 Tax=Ustilaginoidea virens TaxID=1159556 RepID=A0A063BLW2_USTVR|nr:uncharacterized protein UV8b_06032 [Ustilaginoidea virens]QUC21785.1 hypothetical protein UV8b_06032 [Ustilaginoidea virens]GAO17423.1 hypothetical protein UVI_02052350 [Ustilaginoidea virens]
MSRQPNDFAKIVLILGSFVGVDGILGLSENSRYAFHPPADDAWKGGQTQELKPPFLCLVFGEHLFDPLGWVVGSDGDSDKCDLQVAETNQTGISRRLLRVDISPVTHNPRITVLSSRTIRLRDGENVLICRTGEPTEFSRPVTIDLGAVTFRAWCPNRTAIEKMGYRRWAKEFSQDILGAVPKYIPSIQSQPETATHNIRCGKHGAVYVNEWGGGGRGMSASVMMVKEIRTGKIFGAKEPYYKTNDDHDAARKRWEALRREYEYIIQLGHPHIVKAYDLVAAEDANCPPWMIVEYIPLNLSETLDDLDEHGRITAMVHLSSALDFMHARGITHRDVKPDNVLVIRDGVLTIKLADFGTSKRNAIGKMDTFTGTEIYMAPELFANPRSYTNKIDLWSLGLIEMQLFSSWNSLLDEEWNPSNFRRWILEKICPHMEEVPERLQPLLKGLLLKSRHKRWRARDCSVFLWKHTEASDVDTANESAAISKKRPASALCDDSFEADERHTSTADDNLSTEDSSRYVRSANPSLSTARARASPGPASSAPTPHADDGYSDDRDSEAEEGGWDGHDVKFEDDWREDEDEE